MKKINIKKAENININNSYNKNTLSMNQRNILQKNNNIINISNKFNYSNIDSSMPLNYKKFIKSRNANYINN